MREKKKTHTHTLHIYRQPYRDRENERETDRQTDRQKDRKIDMYKVRQTERQMCKY